MELVVLFAVLGIVIAFLFFRDRKDRHYDTEISLPAKRTRVRPYDRTKARPAPSKRLISGLAHVIDGDSIVIKKTQIRLFGIDAPELNHPYGQKAKWALVKLCKGNEITAEIVEEDSHGRTVAKCTFSDGRDLSAEMVKSGLAIDWPKFSGGKYRSLEQSDSRKKMWLADARQKGRMHVWEQFEARQAERRVPE